MKKNLAWMIGAILIGAFLCSALVTLLADKI